MNAPLAKIQMAEKTEAEKRKQKVYDVFYQWDSDMNGYIERGEFRGVLIKIGVSSSDIDTIFKQVDKNKDKKINYEEFFTWLYGEAKPGEEAGEKVMTYVERTTIPAEACKDFLAFMKELQEEAVIQRKDKNKKLDGKKKRGRMDPKIQEAQGSLQRDGYQSQRLDQQVRVAGRRPQLGPYRTRLSAGRRISSVD